MKILEIKDNRGYFRVSDEEELILIDEIDKESIMKLIDKVLSSEVEFDEFEEDKISNTADSIIYKSIYEKFRDLAKNKGKFQDEVDRLYLDELKRYQQDA